LFHAQGNFSPHAVHYGKFRKRRNKQQTLQKKYHDRNSKKLNPLQAGQAVQAQIHGKAWESGVIKKADTNPLHN
jgi:hypothetical protein